MDEILEKLSKEHEIEAYMIQAANNYLSLVLKFVQITQHEFSPAITRIAMELHEAVSEKTPFKEVWSKYIELVKTAQLEGLDLSEIPLKAFGHTIH